MSEDADSGVSVIHEVPRRGVGPDYPAFVYEAVCLYRLIGSDPAFNELDSPLWIVVSVVMPPPELVVVSTSIRVFIASFPCFYICFPFASTFGVCLGDGEKEVSWGEFSLCDSVNHRGIGGFIYINGY